MNSKNMVDFVDSETLSQHHVFSLDVVANLHFLLHGLVDLNLLLELLRERIYISSDIAKGYTGFRGKLDLCKFPDLLQTPIPCMRGGLLIGDLAI